MVQVLIPCRVDTGASVGNENKVSSGHCESDEQWSETRSGLMNENLVEDLRIIGRYLDDLKSLNFFFN